MYRVLEHVSTMFLEGPEADKKKVSAREAQVDNLEQLKDIPWICETVNSRPGFSRLSAHLYKVDETAEEAFFLMAEYDKGTFWVILARVWAPHALADEVFPMWQKRQRVDIIENQPTLKIEGS
jgi:hypothetical protein